MGIGSTQYFNKVRVSSINPVILGYQKYQREENEGATTHCTMRHYTKSLQHNNEYI